MPLNTIKYALWCYEQELFLKGSPVLRVGNRSVTDDSRMLKAQADDMNKTQRECGNGGAVARPVESLQ